MSIVSRYLTHSEIEGLLAPFALDAVDVDEREAVEAHLADCLRCRVEVAEYRSRPLRSAGQRCPHPTSGTGWPAASTSRLFFGGSASVFSGSGRLLRLGDGHVRPAGERRGRVALVTGASSGIGRATALELRRLGFTVYAAARRADRMSDLAAEGIRTVSMDVTDEASVTAGVDQIMAEAGRIDVLVNNAGYGSYGSLEDVPLSEGRYQFEVNVFGLARLVQLVLPQMRERAAAGSSTSRRWAARSTSPSAPGITPPSSRSRD